MIEIVFKSAVAKVTSLEDQVASNKRFSLEDKEVDDETVTEGTSNSADLENQMRAKKGYQVDYRK